MISCRVPVAGCGVPGGEGAASHSQLPVLSGRPGGVVSCRVPVDRFRFWFL